MGAGVGGGRCWPTRSTDRGMVSTVSFYLWGKLRRLSSGISDSCLYSVPLPPFSSVCRQSLSRRGQEGMREHMTGAISLTGGREPDPLKICEGDKLGSLTVLQREAIGGCLHWHTRQCYCVNPWQSHPGCSTQSPSLLQCLRRCTCLEMHWAINLSVNDSPLWLPHCSMDDFALG